MNTIRCNKCWFHGTEEDLIIFHTEFSTPEEPDFAKGCPNCKDDGYLMDLDDKRVNHPIWKAIHNKEMVNL